MNTVTLDIDENGDILVLYDKPSMDIKDVEQLVNKVAKDFAFSDYAPQIKTFIFNLIKRNRQLYWLNVLFFGIILFLSILLWR